MLMLRAHYTAIPLLVALTLLGPTGCVAIWHEPTTGVNLNSFGLDTTTRQQLLIRPASPHTHASTHSRSLAHAPIPAPVRIALAEIGTEEHQLTQSPTPPIILVRERGLAVPPTDHDLRRLEDLPGIDHAFPLDPRALIHPFQTTSQLFELARAQDADLLVVYTFTSRADHQDQAPLFSALTLGLIPTWTAKGRAAIELAVFDLRDQSPLVFDQREADAFRLGNFYSTHDQLDDATHAARRDAFNQALDALINHWPNLLQAPIHPPS